MTSEASTSTEKNEENGLTSLEKPNLQASDTISTSSGEEDIQEEILSRSSDDNHANEKAFENNWRWWRHANIQKVVKF